MTANSRSRPRVLYSLLTAAGLLIATAPIVAWTSGVALVFALPILLVGLAVIALLYSSPESDAVDAVSEGLEEPPRSDEVEDLESTPGERARGDSSEVGEVFAADDSPDAVSGPAEPEERAAKS